MRVTRRPGAGHENNERHGTGHESTLGDLEQVMRIIGRSGAGHKNN